MNYFFIGIKGAGLAAVATLLKQAGHNVAGVDVKHYIFTEEKIKKQGIPIYNFENLDSLDYDIFIYSTAFANCSLLKQLIADGKKVIEYHTFVAALSLKYKLIAVAGTHGKTTTSSIIYNMLNNFAATAAIIGEGFGHYAVEQSYLVLESCEYKNHFLSYYPKIAIINNIEYDHSDFFTSVEQYKTAFDRFSQNAKTIIYNGDYGYLYPGISFGFKESNDVCALNSITDNTGISFDLIINKKFIKRLHFTYFGNYMILNILAAIALCYHLGLDLNKAIIGINDFKGVSRRFREMIFNDRVVIDDYAHHPSAIKETIAAAKSKYPQLRIIAIFQPDRYSRVITFVKQFQDALSHADEAYVLPFPANAPLEDKIIDASIIANNYIKAIATSDLAKLNEKKECLYLFMSSKDQQNNIKMLLN